MRDELWKKETNGSGVLELLSPVAQNVCLGREPVEVRASFGRIGLEVGDLGEEVLEKRVRGDRRVLRMGDLDEARAQVSEMRFDEKEGNKQIGGKEREWTKEGDEPESEVDRWTSPA